MNWQIYDDDGAIIGALVTTDVLSKPCWGRDVYGVQPPCKRIDDYANLCAVDMSAAGDLQ